MIALSDVAAEAGEKCHGFGVLDAFGDRGLGFAGGETFASKIAYNAAEFDSPAKTGAFISAGLALFVLTFLVNAAARAIVGRRQA